MKKNIPALLAIAAAFGFSAFTIPEPGYLPFKYSNNGSAPSGANEITLDQYNQCPTDGTLQICGTKWDFAVPSSPSLVETRRIRVQ